MGLLSGAASLGKAVLDLGADDTNLRSDIQSAKGTVSSALGSISKIAGGILAAGVIQNIGSAVFDFAKESVSSAGDFAETMSKFEVSFGGAAAGIEQDLDSFADAVGRNRYELIGMAADQGAVLKSLGLSESAAADYSSMLTQLAVDVGSFNNAQSSDVQNAFTKAMTGEFESLKSYGIVLNQTMLKEKLRAMGIEDDINAVDQATKAEAIYQLLLERTADAQGDAERTSGSYANQMVALVSKWDEFKTMIGTNVLPLLTPLLSNFNDMASDILPKVAEGVGFVIEKFGQILSGDVSLMDLIPPGLREGINSIITGFTDLFSAVEGQAPAAKETLNEFLTWAQENLFPMLSNTFTNIGTILSTLADLWAKYGDEIMAVVSWVFKFVITVIEGAIQWISGIIAAGLQLINGDWEGAWETIKETFNTFMDTILSLAGTNLEEFVAVWTNNFEMLKVIVSTSLENAKTAITDKVSDFVQSGKDLVNGLIEGVRAKIQEFKDLVASLATDALASITDILGIHSPSKVFAEIGENIMVGWQQGLLANALLPIQATAMVAGNLSAAGAVGAAGVLGSSGTSNIFQFTIYADRYTDTESLKTSVKQGVIEAQRAKGER